MDVWRQLDSRSVLCHLYNVSYFQTILHRVSMQGDLLRGDADRPGLRQQPSRRVAGEVGTRTIPCRLRVTIIIT